MSPREVLVSFRPDDGLRRGGGSGARYEMATVDKTYTPSVMAVPRGAEVHFPNQDRILHNVFSVSGENSFDLELMDGGESRSHVFTEPGLARIFCNVHRDMVGYIWVLETPHWTRPDIDGNFELEDLPLGPGKLTVWHPRASAEVVDVEIVSRGPRQSFDLKITRPRLPSHTRKDGSAYRTRDRY